MSIGSWLRAVRAQRAQPSAGANTGTATVENVRTAAAAGRTADAAVELADAADDLAESAIDLSADPVEDPEVREREAGVDEEHPLGRPGERTRPSPFRIGFSAALGVALAYILYQAVVRSVGVLVLVVVALFLAIGMDPLVSRLQRRGMRRPWAVTIVFLGLLALFGLIGYAVLPPLIDQVSQLVTDVPDYVSRLRENSTVRGLDDRFHVLDRVEAYIENGDLTRTLRGNAFSAGTAIASALFNTFTILILTLYFVAYLESMKAFVYRLFPRSRRARVVLMGDEIVGQIGGYVAGNLFISLVAGVGTLIWAFIVGLPLPFVLALAVAVLDLVPLIGATLGAIIVSVVALFVSLPVGIATAIFFLIYQQLENYVLYPRVMKKSVKINPASTVVGALVGAALMGMVGALVAIPLAAALEMVLREIVIPRQEET